ncbi:MAG: GNAT family N-acetyltransferase [Myxococcota bacterium]
MIRAATRADLGEVVSALLALNANGSAADPRYRLRPDAKLRELLSAEWFDRFLPFPACWVSPGATGLVGVISCQIVPEHPVLDQAPTVRIDNLWVAPEHRRAGLGLALVEKVREQASRAGFPRLVASTLAQDAQALAFWRRAGFSDLNVLLARTD